ncbi:MAG: hypothetical protein ABTD50_20500 [Polyangiaceae bacterium]
MVRRLYDYGWSEGRERQSTMVESIWTNAEDFLDYVDTAADPGSAEEDNPHAARINEIMSRAFGGHNDAVGITPDRLATAARRLVAAECCAFLEGTSIHREQWRPFRHWAARLSENDTVVTFNYDRVIETLRDAQNKEAVNGEKPPSALKVVLPEQTTDRGDLQGYCPC